MHYHFYVFLRKISRVEKVQIKEQGQANPPLERKYEKNKASIKLTIRLLNHF